MFLGVLLLLPLLAEGLFFNNLFCNLPDASTESLNITTAEKTWYTQYQYNIPGASLLGCLVVTQSPRESSDEMNINGTFSRVPLLPVNAVGKFTGNRMDTEVDGIWNLPLSGPHNVVYTDDEIFIEHLCVSGIENSFILTTEETLSEELEARIWEIVENHPEVSKSKYVKTVC
ncbi:uncharacterized protein LOC124622028 [Schistocerca americana]|uniref:uncharacterized protein LOC124622028 n=1 Tax=Schistocerca americana TaxID=7009 RepID=UPI001F4F935B|nr:uncharacterized protein LOC124622028 [Schistocerca americana]XP_047120860.1 uncharacterized protein LOC124804664 [Schistocerca piceifrons]XP_047120861.1 uncharacterized protein LOC124804665 [Schistocerca piceifrons]XP_049937562.1 uncharacterized protein LOC126412147 [Schistocerca serialis cubense]